MMKALKMFCTGILFAFVVSGCDSAQPLEVLPPDAVILAFGDSLTYGTGAAKDESYPAVLENLLGRTVINAGIPGEISSEGRTRLPEVLAEVKPDLLILCHGGNDLLRRGSAEQLKRNLNNMIKTATEQGIPVLLIAVPEPSILLSPPSLYSDLAEQYQLNIEMSVLRNVLSDRNLKSDPIHPNAAGYRLIAQAISEHLLSAGAINFITEAHY